MYGYLTVRMYSILGLGLECVVIGMEDVVLGE